MNALVIPSVIVVAALGTALRFFSAPAEQRTMRRLRRTTALTIAVWADVAVLMAMFAMFEPRLWIAGGIWYLANMTAFVAVVTMLRRGRRSFPSPRLVDVAQFWTVRRNIGILTIPMAAGLLLAIWVGALPVWAFTALLVPLLSWFLLGWLLETGRHADDAHPDAIGRPSD